MMGLRSRMRWRSCLGWWSWILDAPTAPCQTARPTVIAMKIDSATHPSFRRRPESRGVRGRVMLFSFLLMWPSQGHSDSERSAAESRNLKSMYSLKRHFHRAPTVIPSAPLSHRPPHCHSERSAAESRNLKSMYSLKRHFHRAPTVIPSAPLSHRPAHCHSERSAAE